MSSTRLCSFISATLAESSTGNPLDDRVNAVRYGQDEQAKIAAAEEEYVCTKGSQTGLDDDCDHESNSAAIVTSTIRKPPKKTFEKKRNRKESMAKVATAFTIVRCGFEI